MGSLNPNSDWAALPLFQRKGWTRVPFGAFAESVNVRVEPADAAEEVYVGLDDLDSGCLHIRRWGKGSDVIGTKLRFRKGDLIFGRRRAYQRKLAVAEMEGICSAHAMVVRAKPDVVRPEFLPFLMMSDKFMRRAVEISVGSLSPTINWTTLKHEEFDLPPLDQQRRIAEILWAVDEAQDASRKMEADAVVAKHRTVDETFEKLRLEAQSGGQASVTMASVAELLADGKSLTYGILQPGADDPDGIPMLRAIDIEDGGLSGTQILRVNRKIEAAYERTRLRGGEILVSVMGTIGRAIVVRKEWQGWNVNRALAVVRVGERAVPEFFYHWLRSPHMQAALTKDSIGTAQLRINLSHFRNYRVPLPSKARQAAAVERIEAAENAQTQISKYSARLTELGMSLINTILK